MRWSIQYRECLDDTVGHGRLCKTSLRVYNRYYSELLSSYTPNNVSRTSARNTRGTCRYVYYHEARRFLGKGPVLGLFSAGEWVRGKGHAMKTQWNAAMAAVDLMQVHATHVPCQTQCLGVML